jgi:hypothetical protein
MLRICKDCHPLSIVWLAESWRFFERHSALAIMLFFFFEVRLFFFSTRLIHPPVSNLTLSSSPQWLVISPFSSPWLLLSLYYQYMALPHHQADPMGNGASLNAAVSLATRVGQHRRSGKHSTAP